MFPDITKYTSVTCQALNNLTKSGRKSLNAIKYICHKKGWNYLDVLFNDIKHEDKTKEYEIAIERAWLYKDLDGYKYILKKYNKNYPESLYSTLSYSKQFERASNLFDLQGIKYIYASAGKHRFEFYSQIIQQSDQLDIAIDYTIKLNDHEGLVDLMSRISNCTEISGQIRQAYYREHLKIAELLIEIHNTHSCHYSLDLPYLSRTNPTENFESYFQHLTSIKIKSNEKSSLNNLLDAMFCKLNNTSEYTTQELSSIGGALYSNHRKEPSVSVSKRVLQFQNIHVLLT